MRTGLLALGRLRQLVAAILFEAGRGLLVVEARAVSWRLGVNTTSISLREVLEAQEVLQTRAAE